MVEGKRPDYGYNWSPMLWSANAEDHLARLQSEGRMRVFRKRQREICGDGLDLKKDQASFWLALRDFPPLEMSAYSPVGNEVFYQSGGVEDVPVVDVSELADDADDHRRESDANAGWFWDIRPKLAERQVTAGVSRVSDVRTDVEWAARNIGNRKATPKGAPSNRAWAMLLLAERTPGKFWDQHKSAVSKSDDETSRLMLDDRRKKFEVLDRLEGVSLESTCSSCGARQ